MTRTTPVAVVGLDAPRPAARRRRARRAPRPSAAPARGPVDRDDAPAGGEVVADVGDGLLDVAAVGRRGLGGDLAGPVVVTVEVEPERADPPPRLALLEHLAAHLADAAQRRGTEVDRRLCRPTQRRPSSRRGTPRWSRPGRGRGCAPARGRAPARGCPAGSSSTSISISSTSAGASDSIPSTAMPSASLSVISASWGCCLAELGGAAAYVVGQQQLAARRRPEPLDLVQGALVGHREACGSRRPRRRRTPPAAGAPRSAGRRRRCRRGRRTRRASRPGRRGSTPHRRAGVRRPRARPPGRGRARPARGRPAP